MSAAGKERVAVVGAGAFGRALAGAIAGNGHEVILYSRSGSAETVAGVTRTGTLSNTADAELIFMAVPSRFVDETATALEPSLDGRHMLVHVNRGLAREEGSPRRHTTGLTTLSERLRDLTPCRRVGALAGPLVPESLAATRPGGAVIGTPFPEVADRVRLALASSSMRVYETADLTGVEIASAFVGVLSIAIGVARGLGVGPGALALLCTRGMSEAARLGAALGAKPETFGGLSGYGDLLACVAGDERAEIRLGEALAAGNSIDEAKAAVGAHVEGIRLSTRLDLFARATHVEAPILAATSAIARAEFGPSEALAALMAREVHKE